MYKRQVGEASNGDEALAVCTRLRPDIVLMDVRMPGVGGIEACRRIRWAVPETRIIMLTMSDEEDDPVSYTHLRAHETVLDLVCRLLLEHKNQPHYPNFLTLNKL